MWAGPNRTEIWDGEERIRGFGDLVPHTIPGRISSRRSYRSAGPLGNTRSHNIEMHRDGPQRYAHQLRARFMPVLPGFYRGLDVRVRHPKGTLVHVATLGMPHSTETNSRLFCSLT